MKKDGTSQSGIIEAIQNMMQFWEITDKAREEGICCGEGEVSGCSSKPSTPKGTLKLVKAKPEDKKL